MIAPIILSLKISIAATLIVFLISSLLIKFLYKSTSLFKNIVETILIVPMVLPPSVVGYFILKVLGRRSPIGKFLFNNFNIQIIFSTEGAIIAAGIVSFPLMYQSIKSSVEAIDISYIEAARTMGASEWRIFTKIILPLCKPGILSGLVLTFSRALGEFGATLMVAGNIPGKTQTIPVAIYFAVESGDNRTANFLVLFITTLSFFFIYILNYRLKK